MLHWCTMINFLKYCPKIVKYICWFEFLDHLKFEFLRSWWLYLAQQRKYLSVIRTKFANFDDCVPHSLEFPDFFPTFAQLYKAKTQLYTPKYYKKYAYALAHKIILVRTLQCTETLISYLFCPWNKMRILYRFSWNFQYCHEGTICSKTKRYDSHLSLYSTCWDI